jgi:sarcosine oxidase subunit alpha
MTRLPGQPAERIDRDAVVQFTFDGKPVSAFAGDTIGSALYAAGQRVFSRSFKYHRRRGLMCCSGSCPNCLVTVDGAPGVRACTEPVSEGAKVEHLNARPSLSFDAMAVIDKVGGPFTPPGFYYKTFIRPRSLWPLYEKVLRNAAGLGRLPERQAERSWKTEYRRRHADLLVVGGGAAGLAAAATAARLGADVVLADEAAELGGRLLWEGGQGLAAELAAEAHDAGVELLVNASALGHYDGLVAVWQGSTLHQIRARRQLYATGAIEQPLVFRGNDLPGVMLSGGARRLAELYSVKPGERAVVATSSDRGLEAALALHARGVEIVLVADLRESGSDAAQALTAAGIEVLSGWTVVGATGASHVEAAVLSPIESLKPDAAPEPRVELECDLLVVSGGCSPATSLPTQAGATTTYDAERGHFALSELPATVSAAGELIGEGGRRQAQVSGELAGVLAASALGFADESDLSGRAESLRAEIENGAGNLEAVPPPDAGDGRRGRSFACFCEDVTAKDIHLAVQEGYDSIELCKRFTTVTMGPCQGRMCQLNAARLISRETGQPLAAVGTTTARPPWATVPLGALAGAPLEPAKRSAIHGRHRELGAQIRWAGDWRRPYDYGDPEGEALAVHQAAGLIDVSTLGKLLVRGPDAAAFLDRLYPNRISTLAPGRVRYGVLTNDAGRITDDGTLTRLDEQTFYVTTTSSGAGAVEQWFSWWLADWRLDVTLTDLTQALCAVNLAGPRAREILATVTDLDVSAAAFGYLDARQGDVAHASALMMRIGFVGELGYELHFPAALGEHVWEALLSAGSEHGIRPFGLEPQRILRLQKQHIIVGQDTDSESNPYNAAMPWAVKLDKDEDFIGKWALERAASDPGATMLVGFTLPDGRAPTEGAAVLDDAGHPAGQVTSTRRSRQLNQVIGMAWVPAALATDGQTITISDGDSRLYGTVATQPFHDPAGELLRS